MKQLIIMAHNLYMLFASCLCYPAGPEHMVDYFEVRAEEPCGKSVIQTIFVALIFMEKAGGVAVGQYMHKGPGLLKVKCNLSF